MLKNIARLSILLVAACADIETVPVASSISSRQVTGSGVDSLLLSGEPSNRERRDLLVIGSRVAIGSRLLERVGTASLANDGAIALYDAKAKQLYHLDSIDADGVAIGRSGSGPGEYASFLGVVHSRQEGVIVWDPMLRRLTKYSRDGALLQTQVLSELPSMFADGILYAGQADEVFIRAGTYEATTYIRVDEGRLTDTIAIPEIERDPNAEGFVHPIPHFALLPTGTVVWTAGRSYTIELHKDESSALVVNWDRVPVPFEPEEREQYQSLTEWMRLRVSQSSENSAGLADVPSNRPAISQIIPQGDGGWAILRERGSQRVTEPARPNPTGQPPVSWFPLHELAVFNSDATLRYVVDLPPRARILSVRGDSLLGMMETPDGEQALTLWSARAR
jgi:hypothetical protein